MTMSVEASNSPMGLQAGGESSEQLQEEKSAAVLAFEREMQALEEKRRQQEREANLMKKQAKKLGKEKAQKHIEGILRELTDEEKRERAAKAEKARLEAEELERQEAEARAAWEAQELKKRQEMQKFAAMAAALEAKREAQQKKLAEKAKKRSMPKKTPVYSSDEDSSDEDSGDDEKSIHMTSPTKQPPNKKSHSSSSDESSDDEGEKNSRRSHRNGDEKAGNATSGSLMKNGGDDSITLPTSTMDNSESSNNEENNNKSPRDFSHGSGLKPYAYVGAPLVQLDTDDESDEENDEIAEAAEDDEEYEIEYKKEMNDEGEIVWSPVRKPKRSVTANLDSSPPTSSPEPAIKSASTNDTSLSSVGNTQTGRQTDENHRKPRSPLEDEKVLKFYRPDYDDDCFPKPVDSPVKRSTVPTSPRKKTSDVARNYMMNASFNNTQNFSWRDSSNKSKSAAYSHNSSGGHSSKGDADPLRKYMDGDDNDATASVTMGSSRHYDDNGSISQNQDHNASFNRLNGSFSSFTAFNTSFSSGVMAEDAIHSRFPKIPKRPAAHAVPSHPSVAADPKQFPLRKEPSWKASRATNVAPPAVDPKQIPLLRREPSWKTNRLPNAAPSMETRTIAGTPTRRNVTTKPLSRTDDACYTPTTTDKTDDPPPEPAWKKSARQSRRASMGATPATLSSSSSSYGPSCLHQSVSVFSPGDLGMEDSGLSSSTYKVKLRKANMTATTTAGAVNLSPEESGLNKRMLRRASMGPMGGSSVEKDAVPFKVQLRKVATTTTTADAATNADTDADAATNLSSGPNILRKRALRRASMGATGELPCEKDPVPFKVQLKKVTPTTTAPAATATDVSSGQSVVTKRMQRRASMGPMGGSHCEKDPAVAPATTAAATNADNDADATILSSGPNILRKRALRRASIGATGESPCEKDPVPFKVQLKKVTTTTTAAAPTDVSLGQSGLTKRMQRRASMGPIGGSYCEKDPAVVPSWKKKLLEKKPMDSPVQNMEQQTDPNPLSWKKKLLEKKPGENQDAETKSLEEKDAQVEDTDAAIPFWKKKLLEKKSEQSPAEERKVSETEALADSPKTATTVAAQSPIVTADILDKTEVETKSLERKPAQVQLPDSAVPSWKKKLLGKKTESAPVLQETVGGLDKTALQDSPKQVTSIPMTQLRIADTANKTIETREVDKKPLVKKAAHVEEHDSTLPSWKEQLSERNMEIAPVHEEKTTVSAVPEQKTLEGNKESLVAHGGTMDGPIVQEEMTERSSVLEDGTENTAGPKETSESQTVPDEKTESQTVPEEKKESQTLPEEKKESQTPPEEKTESQTPPDEKTESQIGLEEKTESQTVFHDETKGWDNQLSDQEGERLHRHTQPEQEQQSQQESEKEQGRSDKDPPAAEAKLAVTTDSGKVVAQTVSISERIEKQPDGRLVKIVTEEILNSDGSKTVKVQRFVRKSKTSNATLTPNTK